MERTFTIIKPNAVAAGATGKIIDHLTGEGFRFVAMRMVWLSGNDAARFYAIHRDKPFFANLIGFMTSGPVVVAVVEHPAAVAHLRRVVGDTDPANAAEGTVRRLYGRDKTQNAIHASDSVENAAIEMGQFFCESDIMNF